MDEKILSNINKTKLRWFELGNQYYGYERNFGGYYSKLSKLG